MDLKFRKKRANWLPVVAGIIRREQSVLLGQRPEGGSLPGLWEFPGGKIEAGEQPEVALARELSEELGINATIGPLKFSTTHSFGEMGVLLLFYEVKYWTGQPTTNHHTELRWVKFDEIAALPLPDANRIVLNRIVELLK
ncbi:MAG: (deoxy)nucleoside triphosphate pyrophosphohydrolase [Bdellovibrionales bacterium]